MNAKISSSDPLFQIERRIARRADELARRCGVNPTDTLAPWRRAEREVWKTLAPRNGLRHGGV